MDGIAQLGLTVQDAKEVIVALTERQYSRGPDMDDDGSNGEIWVFAADIDGVQTYIKLKFDGSEAKCLSFHPASYRMPMPYK